MAHSLLADNGVENLQTGSLSCLVINAPHLSCMGIHYNNLFIVVADRHIWEVWEDKNTAFEPNPYKSCTIITTDASDSVKDIHNRMPLILKPEVYGEWLDSENMEPARIEEVLKKGCVKVLKRYPVSKLVNHVGNNSKECMETTDIPKKNSLGAGVTE